MTKLTVYQGSVPDKKTMNKTVFALSVHNWLAYISVTHAPQMNTVVDEIGAAVIAIEGFTQTAQSAAGMVTAKEALLSPHYSNIDTVSENIASINTIVLNITDIQNANANAQIALEASAIAAYSIKYKGDWSAEYDIQGYSLGDSVTFTDGFNYVSKIGNNLTSPITQTNTPQWNFIEAVSPAQLILKADKTTTYTKTEVDTSIQALSFKSFFYGGF